MRKLSTLQPASFDINTCCDPKRIIERPFYRSRKGRVNYIGFTAPLGKHSTAIKTIKSHIMDRNEGETASSLSNTTRTMHYCFHAPGLILDVHDTTYPWILATVATILSPAAFLLNVLIILAATQRRELQTLSNILLKRMAITDLLVGGISIPLSAIVGLLLPHNVLSKRHFCMVDLVTFSFTLTLSVCSLFHLTLIAWERYMAIRKWVDYKLKVTESLLKKLPITAWVLAIVGVSPYFFIMTAMGGNAQAIALKIWSIGLCSLIVGALAFIVYFYVMVYYEVSKRKSSKVRQFNKLAQEKLESRVATTAALVTTALILSFLPIGLAALLGELFPFFRKFVASRIGESMLYSNSVANPLLYCYRDRRFRNAVFEILRIRRPKTNLKQFPVHGSAQKDVHASMKDNVKIEKIENPEGLTRS